MFLTLLTHESSVSQVNLTSSPWFGGPEGQRDCEALNDGFRDHDNRPFCHPRCRDIAYPGDGSKAIRVVPTPLKGPTDDFTVPIQGRTQSLNARNAYEA